MYQLLKLFFVLLLVSGFTIYFWRTSLFLGIFHTILGFFFVAFFFLYILQHIKKYQDSFSLQSKHQKKSSAWSGVIYLLVFIINFYSGLMLFFYTLDFVPIWNFIHFYSSFLIVVTSLLHLFTRRKK